MNSVVLQDNYIPPKNNFKFKKLLLHIQDKKMSLFLNNRLYHKYSKAQDYYYKKLIDNKIQEDFINENSDDSSKYMQKFYNKQEQCWNLQQIIEYYKFHEEVPRLFMKNLSNIIHFFYDKKRRIKYKKITKQLGLNYSIKESHITSRQNTYSQLTNDHESLQNFLQKNLQSFSEENTKKIQIVLDDTTFQDSRTLQDIQLELSMIIKKEEGQKEQKNQSKKKQLSRNQISYDLKNINYDLFKKFDTVQVQDQKTFSKLNCRPKRFMKGTKSITKENNSSGLNKKANNTKKFQTLNINQLNININLDLNKKQKNKLNKKKFSQFLKKEAKIHTNNIKDNIAKKKRQNTIKKQQILNFQKCNKNNKDNKFKKQCSSIQIKNRSLRKSKNIDLIQKVMKLKQSKDTNKSKQKSTLNKKKMSKNKIMKIDLKQLKNVKSLMLRNQNKKLIENFLIKQKNSRKDQNGLIQSQNKFRKSIKQNVFAVPIKSKTFEKNFKKKNLSHDNQRLHV